ncbi:MAG: hypothetical protein M3460_11630 [Actinomycetota bacterium]|nr:hypothetical protein [Actinomycetota bacterium]
MPSKLSSRRPSVVRMMMSQLVARHEAWIDLAMQHATPYAEYLAQDPTREEPSPRAV